MGQTTSSVFTSDFRHEYEAERERWLRRRFLWYSAIVGGLGLVRSIGFAGVLVLVPAVAGDARASNAAVWIDLIMSLVGGVMFLAAFQYVRTARPMREQVLRLVYGLIVVNGLVQLFGPLAAAQLGEISQTPLGAAWLQNVLVMHIFACLFLPWTPRESFKPLVPLLIVNAGFTLFAGHDWLMKALVIGLSPLIGAPGAAICWWRYSRFRDRFTLNMLRGKYAELRQELLSARQIHEALFPRPVREGPLRFDFVYEPMRQIGGDYLYATVTAGDHGQRVLNVVLLDVTGHGIPAALTVNRLHGELERIYAENPAARPGEVLTLLNRYVHLTLATHSVYVTALCFRVDAERDVLEYASGGHPPAFIRSIDGRIEQLDSTALVLGASAGPDFEAAPRECRFGLGDALIAYTDGATEARDAQGRYLGIAGIQAVIAAGVPAGGWPAAIAAAVERHRHGPSADDTLVIEITRPLVPQEIRVRGPQSAVAAGA
jgi:hypothetical protein